MQQMHEGTSKREGAAGKMIEIGRVCVKTAGRDAGLRCVVVEVVDEKTVLIDGQTRRKNCNTKHLEPLKQSIKLTKGASHATVVSEFKKLGIEITEKKAREKPKTKKPVKKRKAILSKEKKEVAQKTKEKGLTKTAKKASKTSKKQ